MIRHTVDRAGMLIPSDRLMAIVNRDHLKFVEEQLGDLPPENVIVQPYCRDTGPGILLPLLHVARRDPEAVVVLLPSDHFIIDEEKFMGCVGRASEFAFNNPESPVIIGVDPEYPETEYGWIERGTELLRESEATFHRVERFWEKPDESIARMLMNRRFLWSTLILVGRADTLLEYFQIYTTVLYNFFQKINSGIGTANEERIVESVFASVPSVNFSSGLLERIPEHLCVMRAAGVRWSDWGDPLRIEHDITRLGKVLQKGAYA
jgi:mannose-1-phosphate guanylyltransferase